MRRKLSGASLSTPGKIMQFIVSIAKLFSKKSYKLVKEGLSDWTNIGAILKTHENSPDHTKHIVMWKDLDNWSKQLTRLRYPLWKPQENDGGRFSLAWSQ